MPAAVVGIKMRRSEQKPATSGHSTARSSERALAPAIFHSANRKYALSMTSLMYSVLIRTISGRPEYVQYLLYNCFTMSSIANTLT